jgi:hypothetical protein
MRVLWLLLVVACTKAEPADTPREPAPVTPVVRQPEWQETMAKQVVAALAANDFERMPKPSRKVAAELRGTDADGFRALSEKLSQAGVDLSKATIAKLELVNAGELINTVEVTLAYQGKRLQFDLTVVQKSGRAELLGTSYWFKWLP